MTAPAGSPLPPVVRASFAHAAAQVIAEQVGARLLHLKGPAVDPTFGRPAGTAGDADVLVHPDDLDRFAAALPAAGWRRHTSFEGGSPFGHAATYWHEHLGYLDVHRHYPGIDAAPAAAFARLWPTRGTARIADRPCPVPDLVGQALVLLLHAARGEGRPGARADAATTWAALGPADQAAVRALARDLHAEVALAAALDELPARGGPAQARLWRSWSTPASPRARWWARFRAAPTRDRIRLAARALVLDRDRLAAELGRRPTRADLARATWARLGRAVGRRR